MDHGALRAPTLKSIARTSLRFGGWALSLAALYLFIRMVMDTGVALPEDGIPGAITVFAFGGICYGLLVGLLSAIWILLASPGTALDAKARLQVAGSYLTSQFAKYLPGNVFQYVARHALGRRLGIAHGTLAAAALVEACLLACAATVLVVLFGIPVLLALFPQLPSVSAAWALLPLLAVPALHYLPGHVRLLGWVPRYPLRSLALSLAGYVAFFLAFGGLFLAILDWLSPVDRSALQVIGGSAAAWLVGFAVPGAPAGAGLREAALALATGATKPSQAVLSAIIIFRMVTLAGDFIAFVAGWAISRATGVGTQPPARAPLRD